MKITTVPLIVSINLNRKYLVETVSRRAGVLLLQNLHFHRPWWSDADAEPPWMGSWRVSARYLRSMSLDIICGTAVSLSAFFNAAIAEKMLRAKLTIDEK